VFSSISGYLDAFEAVREEVAGHHDREVDPYPGPEAVAEEQAAELTETIEMPLTWGGAASLPAVKTVSRTDSDGSVATRWRVHPSVHGESR
jgi:hypothetical protein